MQENRLVAQLQHPFCCDLLVAHVVNCGSMFAVSQVLNVNKRAGYHDIKKAYQKAKQEAEEGKSSYELAEIKEAFDIMSHPEARIYYNLYAAKPPAMMKHQQKVTHGGWGVEIGYVLLAGCVYLWPINGCVQSKWMRIMHNNPLHFMSVSAWVHSNMLFLKHGWIILTTDGLTLGSSCMPFLLSPCTQAHSCTRLLACCEGILKCVLCFLRHPTNLQERSTNFSCP